MLYISHRGNLSGANPEKENSPDYIKLALDAGFFVEIDVWAHPVKGWWLGHDRPQYLVSESLLLSQHKNLLFSNKGRLWVHCKNIVALHHGLANGLHCFWHQEDDCTLTSDGWVWVYPGKPIPERSGIAVLPERVPNWDISNAEGVCSDYIESYVRK